MAHGACEGEKDARNPFEEEKRQREQQGAQNRVIFSPMASHSHHSEGIQSTERAMGMVGIGKKTSEDNRDEACGTDRNAADMQ